MSSILVADDDPFILEFIETILSSAGYSVMTASGGKDVLERLKEQHHDLVLLDVVMPDQGGIETIIDLRRNHPDLRVIIMSGVVPTASATLRELTRKLGVKTVLAKPFTKEDLLQMIEEELSA